MVQIGLPLALAKASVRSAASRTMADPLQQTSDHMNQRAQAHLAEAAAIAQRVSKMSGSSDVRSTRGSFDGAPSLLCMPVARRRARHVFATRLLWSVCR